MFIRDLLTNCISIIIYTIWLLSLRKNQFGDEGARALGQALEKNNTLEALR